MFGSLAYTHTCTILVFFLKAAWLFVLTVPCPRRNKWGLLMLAWVSIVEPLKPQTNNTVFLQTYYSILQRARFCRIVLASRFLVFVLLHTQTLCHVKSKDGHICCASLWQLKYESESCLRKGFSEQSMFILEKSYAQPYKGQTLKYHHWCVFALRCQIAAGWGLALGFLACWFLQPRIHSDIGANSILTVISHTDNTLKMF